MRLKRIGIIPKRNKKEALDTIAVLTPWLAERGIEPVIDNETAQQLGQTSPIYREEIAKHSDMLIILGGDGTLLYGARIVGESQVPIFGVNLGSLGFLTEISLPELYTSLEKVIAGNFSLEDRMMLHATFEDRGKKNFYSVLNDVVIHKGDIARIITLEVTIDGAFLTTYRGDGLIIATPTGSTGYSLSAGGPIVHPSLSMIILTPICPHTLTDRPIIVPDSSIIEITLKAGDENVRVTFDGQVGAGFAEEKRVVVTKSERQMRLVSPSERDYYDVLRSKLKWGGK